VPSRRFRSPLVAAALVGSAWLAAPADVAAIASSPTAPPAAVAVAPDDTVNPFLPEDRAISDCVSALPKPGCGSKARGGWHQYLVAIAMFGGLTIIGWRIVAGVRRARLEPPATA
jgi:hypothetical protein